MPKFFRLENGPGAVGGGVGMIGVMAPLGETVMPAAPADCAGTEPAGMVNGVAPGSEPVAEVIASAAPPLGSVMVGSAPPNRPFRKNLRAQLEWVAAL